MLCVMAGEEWTPCRMCGAEYAPDAPDDRKWLFVEVDRLHAPGYWQAVFCSEAHAAQWFGPPMPAPDLLVEGPAPESARHRLLFYLGASAVVFVVIAIIALAIFGAVTLLR